MYLHDIIFNWHWPVLKAGFQKSHPHPPRGRSVVRCSFNWQGKTLLSSTVELQELRSRATDNKPEIFFFFYITRLRGLMFAWSRCGLWVTAYSTLTVTILYAKRQRSFLVNPRGLSSNLSTWFTKSFSTSSGRSPVRTNVYVLQHSCLSQQFASLGLLSSYCEVRASQLGPISPVRYASNTLSIISSSHFPYLPRFDILISTQIENHQKDI
jgi:hypothetical protein